VYQQLLSGVDPSVKANSRRSREIQISGIIPVDRHVSNISTASASEVIFFGFRRFKAMIGHDRIRILHATVDNDEFLLFVLLRVGFYSDSVVGPRSTH